MIKLEVVAWQDALDRLSGPWEQLIREGGFNLSHHPQWIAAAAASQGATARLKVFTMLDGDRLLGIIPFFRRKRRMAGLTLRSIELAGNLFAYHHQVVTAADRPAPVLRSFLRHSSITPWDVFCGVGILSGSPMAVAMRALTTELASRLIYLPGDASPFLPCDREWDDYIASRSGNFRYNLRRRQRDVKQRPECRVVSYTAPGDVEELLEAMLRIETRSWKSERGTDIANSRMEREYHEALLPFLAARRALLADVLFDGARPVAYTLCCRWNGWFGQLKTSFDQAFAALSPGPFVTDVMVERAFRTKALEFDFLGDAVPHKLAWITSLRHHESLFLFSRHLRARLIGRIKQLGGAFRRLRSERSSSQ